MGKDNQAKQAKILLENLPAFKAFLKQICPKILEDSLYIVEKGWAEEISYDDLSHVHIALPCEIDKKDLNSLEELLSNVLFLYHTFEFKITNEEQKRNRNIYSTLHKKPSPLNAEKLDIKTNSENTIFLFDLNAWEIASGKFYINKKPEILNKKYDVSITLKRNKQKFNFVFHPLESMIKDYL